MMREVVLRVIENNNTTNSTIVKNNFDFKTFEKILNETMAKYGDNNVQVELDKIKSQENLKQDFWIEDLQARLLCQIEEYNRHWKDYDSEPEETRIVSAYLATNYNHALGNSSLETALFIPFKNDEHARDVLELIMFAYGEDVAFPEASRFGEVDKCQQKHFTNLKAEYDNNIDEIRFGYDGLVVTRSGWCYIDRPTELKKLPPFVVPDLEGTVI